MINRHITIHKGKANVVTLPLKEWRMRAPELQPTAGCQKVVMGFTKDRNKLSATSCLIAPVERAINLQTAIRVGNILLL